MASSFFHRDRGKTTLLSEWRMVYLGDEYPLAWLSLEEADNDPNCRRPLERSATGTIATPGSGTPPSPSTP